MIHDTWPTCPQCEHELDLIAGTHLCVCPRCGWSPSDDALADSFVEGEGPEHFDDCEPPSEWPPAEAVAFPAYEWSGWRGSLN